MRGTQRQMPVIVSSFWIYWYELMIAVRSGVPTGYNGATVKGEL